MAASSPSKDHDQETGASLPSKDDPIHDSHADPDADDGKSDATSTSWGSVSKFGTVFDVYDECAEIIYRDPGSDIWGSLDDKAMRKVNYDLACHLSEMENGDVRNLYDVQQELDRRWEVLEPPFEMNVNRPDPEKDEQRYTAYYESKIVEKELRLVVLEERTNYYGFESVASVVEPGLDPEAEIWTEIKTISKPSSKSQRKRKNKSGRTIASSLIATIEDRVLLIITETFCENDENRFVIGKRAAATLKTPNGDRIPIAPSLGENQALPSSELLYQQLRSVLGMEILEKKALEIVWHFNVTNLVTRRTILGAHKTMSWSGRCWGRFRADGVADDNGEKWQNEQKEFQNLMATDNGIAVVWMTSNHRDIFPVRVHEVYTFPPCSVPGLDQFHIAFKLQKI